MSVDPSNENEDRDPTGREPVDPDAASFEDVTEAEAAELAAADARIDADEFDNGTDAGLDADPEADVDEYAEEMAARAAAMPPEETDVPADAPKFYESTADLHALDDINFADRPSVLERLGPAHFRSKGFSFMGFLQTVYDHVAGEMKNPTHNNPRDPATPSEQD
jgi:hypothetical protein